MTGFFATPQTSANWKQTSLGSPIELVACAPWQELRPGGAAQRPILVMGGIHGDEPEGVRLAQDLLAWLKTKADERCALAPWIVIPCLNVDGFAKNTRVNGRGVDLNRNYPSKDWSPKADKERYFPGTAPGSETEIQAVVELIREVNPRLLIHCHSWEPCIVATGQLAHRDAERLSKSSGYKLVDEIGYPTPGSLSRYGWHDLGIPVICIEERDHLQDLATIWPRFEKGMSEIFMDTSDRSQDFITDKKGDPA